MTGPVKHEIEVALDGFKVWNDRATQMCSGIPLVDGLKPRVACALFHLGMGHSVAIAVLIAVGQMSSALALYRLQLEAYVRGMWILQCATDQQVENVANDVNHAFPNFTDLTLAVDGASGSERLSQLRKAQWTRLNDFTHGGATQIGSRLVTSVMQANFDKQTVLRFLKASASLSSLTAAGLLMALNRHDLVLSMHEAFDQSFPTGWCD